MSAESIRATEGVPDLPEALQQRPAVAEAYARYGAAIEGRRSDLPRFAACGMYNAGKSTLLNVLAGHSAEEGAPFATGAGRCTLAVAEHRAQGFLAVDTPGIDGDAGDDATAWSGLQAVDYFLYAHSLAAIEIERQEGEFLDRLRRQMPGLKRRFVLVLTHMDAAGSEEELARRRQHVVEAIAAVLGFQPVQFAVSAQRFLAGVRTGKPVLVERSGIAALQAWVAGEADAGGAGHWRKQRANRIRKAHALLVHAIDAEVLALEQQIQQRSQALRQRQGSFTRAALALQQRIRQRLERIDALA